MDSSSIGESVMVVMDRNRGKASLDALEWAIKYIVGPNDTVVVLGVLPEIGKKAAPSCLPFNVGIGTSGIWMKLEFSTSGPGEMTPSELQEEIGRKKREYQKFLQPYYHNCKKREVTLDIRLAAGYESKKIAVEEAQKLDPRWIVLDEYLKKDKEYIHRNVDCHLALLKAKGVATLIPSKITGPECKEWQTVCRKIDDQAFIAEDTVKEPHSPKQTPPIPCSYPLSWRTGFPRAFSLAEIEEMTNGFKDIALKDQHKIMYKGVFEEFPVVVMRFPADDQAVSLLKIVSRVRHRNILNLVGYCCIGDSIFLLCDCPKASLELCLLCDNSAANLSWDARWGIALQIGEGIRYLHEEFVDGSIVNLSVCSANVALNSGSSAMLCIYDTTAKQLNVDDDPLKELQSVKCENIDTNEQLRADIKDYGVLLLELITGQNKRLFSKDGQCLVDWALSHLEKNLLSPLLDPRLSEPGDREVAHMAKAAFACLKTDSSHNLTISKVLAVARGNQ
ncbi:probable serine/threonine-protein kinase At1g01540 isoform X1 [Cynara cardunculus var. scolymus]|uniref:probable serine/threonine-protein kinase At1g01540 isoform X1 n=1 Tax=Cynara cardunculus var. scolymus TaxID=59895 RepID=UPI000D627B39|nr:probable serine/threonine-protein kinase At1g01540 isoform X1 [Cynara cardunculus var. scolymus]